MAKLNDFSALDTESVAQAAERFDTPVYIYDESTILERCHECIGMPNAYGLTVRYAMKANSNRTLLRIISEAGLHFDASSINEAIRAHLAGIPYSKIMLTTQDVYSGENKTRLEELLLSGLNYNVCSLRQLQEVAVFASREKITPGIRVHPGIGSGESSTRNTGDDYACFGVHLSDIAEAYGYAKEYGLQFKHIHAHIGSGGDPAIWQESIDVELGIIEEFFPDAESVGFGGGLREARMPDEDAADVASLGQYAKRRVEEFYNKTGRKLKMEIEPGTYIAANSGYAVTRVIDKKRTSRASFVIVDGGMEINARPLLYGSRHPIYIVSEDGSSLKSSEFDGRDSAYQAVLVGKCCESGDSQTLSMEGHALSRKMAEPNIGDFAIIGGTGAYCSSMSPFNYNSYTQIPEVLFTKSGELTLIRKRQTLEQILENEV